MSKSAGPEILRKAFSLDRRGLEAAAIPLYQRALRLKLNSIQRRDAMICLASSLRTVGRSKSALSVLRKAHRLFPNDPVVQLFTALVHHNLGNHSAALGLLGKMYLNESRAPALAPYRRVLLRKFRAL